MSEAVIDNKLDRQRGARKSSFEPQYRLRGTVKVPGDKSISHRSALLAAMSEGATTIKHYLNSADTNATLNAVRKLGAQVEGQGDELRIQGIGLRGPKSADVDFLNASTPLSLSAGWLAGQSDGEWLFSGDRSLHKRPVDRIATPLEEMGALVECMTNSCYPPLRIRGGAQLVGMEHLLQIPSAQVKSSLMFAALFAHGPTTILEVIPARDHTERMLSAAGAAIDVTPVDGSAHSTEAAQAKRILVEPASAPLELPPIEVPGDFSSAAFFLVGAALLPGSEIRAVNIGINPTRTGLLNILDRMGAKIDIDNRRDVGGEPVADVTVRHSHLSATSIEADEVPIAIDEMPLVALLGCFAEGRTVVSGAAKLRNKESDRIRGVVDGFRGLGADITETDDGFAVTSGRTLTGGVFAANGDHRLAMLGKIAGLLAHDEVKVPEMAVASVSYPSFTDDLQRLAS